MAKSMAQLTSAMTSPRRMRKIQSSPTLEMRNRWHCKAQTAGTRAGLGLGALGMGTLGWQGHTGRDTSAHNQRHQPHTAGTTVPSHHSHSAAISGLQLYTAAHGVAGHTPPASTDPPAWPQAERPGAYRSLQCAWLFWVIVSTLPGGQVALSSAPVSCDSQRNSTHCHRGRVGSCAQTTCCRGAVPTSVPPTSPSPVALTTARGTAALGVLQQLRWAAGPEGVPLPLSLLQPQPGGLVLGKGAQVLRVAPVHLGEKEGTRV